MLKHHAVSRWEKISAISAGASTALIGGAYLAAWLGGVMTQRGVSAITMKTNAALCLLLLGAALLLSAWSRAGAAARWTGRACAALALLIGALTLSENLIGWDLGIDQLLASERPGAMGVVRPNRMGIPGSGCVVLAALALLFLSRRGERGLKAAQGLALGVCLIALLSTIGYLYGVQALYGLAPFTAIAWPTALTLLVLGVGLLFARAREGFMAQVMADDPGGTILRRRLLPALLLPVVLGWLRLTGEREGLYDTALGTTLLIIAFITGICVLAWLTSRWVSRSAAALHESEARLRVTFDNAALGIVMTDHQDRFVAVNERICQILGYRREELLDLSVRDLTDPEDRPRSDEENAQLHEGRIQRIDHEKRYLRKDGTPLLSELLGLWGHEVRTACDGPHALAAAREQQPEVILLDIGLPGMDGYQVAGHLRREPGTERAYIVALTGYGAEEDRRRSQEAGFDHHLTKPVELERLQAVLMKSCAA